MLRAGWASADITPPAGTDLSGFGGRAGPSEGVHDRLTAKALCAADGRQRVWLITADLIGLDADTVADVRKRVGERLDEPAPQVMIACSHTHSGPATPCLPFLGEPDTEYMRNLVERLVDIAAEAADRAAEAQAGYGQGEAQVGINRREWTADGRMVLGLNEGGTTAPYVDVLKLQADDGCAVLFSHAAHPVTLGGNNLLISADWPGYAQRFVEKALGGNCLALFGQGCCGNINSEPRGSFDVAEEQGRKVAEVVAKTAAGIQLSTAGPVAGRSVVAQLPLEDPPPVDEARAILGSAEGELEANAETDNYGVRKTRQGLVAWANRLLELAEAGATGLTQPFEIHALRIGDTAIVGLPGEVFVEYQHQIRQCSPFPRTIVLAYTNGNIGYLPTAEAFPEGGYEVDSAIKYYGATMLTPDCERIVVESACELLGGMGDE